MLKEIYNDLKAGFQESQTNSDAVEDLMKASSSYVLRNIEPILARFVPRVRMVKGDDGKYSAREILRELTGDEEMLALFIMFRHSKRASLVPKQNTTVYSNYSLLVPFLLYPFKRYADIPYSAWSCSEKDYLFHPGLNESVFSEDAKAAMALGSEEILEARQVALTVKTGAKAGDTRPADTTYMLYPPKDSLFAKLPQLARHMVFQTWCAHPSKRNKYMILDPRDWDSMPEPLINTGNLAYGDINLKLPEATYTKPSTYVKRKSEDDEPLWV